MCVFLHSSSVSDMSLEKFIFCSVAYVLTLSFSLASEGFGVCVWWGWEVGSYCIGWHETYRVNQTGLAITEIRLPLLPKHWDCRCASACLAEAEILKYILTVHLWTMLLVSCLRSDLPVCRRPPSYSPVIPSRRFKFYTLQSSL